MRAIAYVHALRLNRAAVALGRFAGLHYDDALWEVLRDDGWPGDDGRHG